MYGKLLRVSVDSPEKKVADLLTEAELMVDPTSFDFQLRVTSRRGIRLCQGYDVTRATTVAPGIERGELGSEEETDCATTE